MTQQSLLPLPALELRDYQQEALDKLLDYRRAGGSRALVALPTGTGKTVIFAQIPRFARKKVLVIAHREELLDQNAEKIQWANPSLKVDIEQAERRATPDAQVIVASIQTLAVSKKRLAALDPDAFSSVIIDEAHHTLAESYLYLLHHFGLAPDPGAAPRLVGDKHNDAVAHHFESFTPNPSAPFLVGLTATPSRSDGQGLEYIYDDIVFSRTIREMMDAGWLCKIRGIKIKTPVDISKVKTQAGDFQEKSLAETIDTPERNAVLVSAYLEHAKDKRALVFCVNVLHAEHVSAAFDAKGIKAPVVVGATPSEQRKATIKAFKAGEVRVMVGVMVFTEGFDAPETNCVIMARPTKSSLVYTQCLDDQTEILTAEGWKSRTEVNVGSLVFGYDIRTGTIQEVRAKSKVERHPRPGEQWVEIANRHLAIKTTEGHRLILKTGRHALRQDNPWFFERMAAAAVRSEFLIPVAGEAKFNGVSLSNDEVRLVGWFIGEGSINKSNRQMVIRQAANSPHIAEIERILRSCGLHYTRNESPGSLTNERTRILTFGVPWGGSNRAMVRHHGPQPDGWARLGRFLAKDIADEMMGMTKGQFAIFLEALWQADGTTSPQRLWRHPGTTITTSNLRMADRLQQIAILRGWKADIGGPFSPRGISKKDKYLVHLKQRPWKQVTPSRAVVTRHKIMPEEVVWCIENRLGTLITRRHGKVAIVGNCIGRGTRIAPGKQDLLVIDLVDVSRKAGIQTINTLFGLPPKLQIGGSQTVAEAQDEYAKYREAMPEELFEGAESIEELEKTAYAFDPLAQTMVGSEILSYVDLAWVRTASGYVLSLLGQGQVGVVEDLLGRAVIRYKPDGQVTQIVGTSINAKEAMRKAELWLLQHAELSSLYERLSRNAKWRQYPASEKQIALLNRLKDEDGDPVRFLPNIITRGQASALIDRYFKHRRPAYIPRNRRG